MYTDLIIAEIHHAINKLGGSARPVTPGEAQRALRDLSAEIDLRSIVDSSQDPACNARDGSQDRRSRLDDGRGRDDGRYNGLDFRRSAHNLGRSKLLS